MRTTGFRGLVGSGSSVFQSYPMTAHRESVGLFLPFFRFRGGTPNRRVALPAELDFSEWSNGPSCPIYLSFTPIYVLNMATQSVSGKTEAELEEIRAEFDSTPRSDLYDFEDCFCLAKIPRQPEDYDGPARYCLQRNLDYDSKRCKFHGGAGHGNPESLDKYANLKHGMKATRKAILDTMTREGNEWQVELYEWVTEEWPEAYDIDVDSDPNAEYEFHALGLEIVRAERAEGWIFKEGEKGQKRVFSPSGEMYFDDIPHYLADMMQRQRKLVMRMEDNLGISRKARLKADETNDAADLVKSFAEVGASLITKSEKVYDPDEFGGPPSDESES